MPTSVNDILEETPPTDSPPKPRRGRPKGSTNVRKEPLEQRLESLVTLGGLMVGSVHPCPVCGLAIVEGAHNFAKALDNLAKQKPAVRKALERVLATSAYVEVLTATAPIITPILIHHRIVPPAIGKLIKVGFPVGSNGNKPDIGSIADDIESTD